MSQAQFQALSTKYLETLAEGEAPDAGEQADATDTSDLKPIATPELTATEQTAKGILVSWNKSKNAQGYTLYRSTDEQLWEEVAQTGSDGRFFHDTNVTAGVQYSYALVATTTAEGKRNSEHSNYLQRLYISAPSITLTKKGKKATVTWKQVKGASGYTIQYATNSLFAKKKTITVKAASTLKATLTGLGKKAVCYVRIRANSNVNGAEQSGLWSYSANAKRNKTAKLTKIKKTKRKYFELRSAAKQKTKGYDTLQGSCTDGTYGYYALYNRTKNMSKLVKVRLKSMKVIKVSKALNIYHANDLTYNSKTKQIVAVHNAGDSRGLSLIDPKTLKVSQTATISKSVKKLFGASEAGISSIDGISSLAYCSQKDCYVATIGTKHDILVLDAEFKATRIIPLSSKSAGVYQNIETSDDMIIMSTSAGGGQKGNYLWCYSWQGKLISKINTPNACELESVFLCGKTMHANFYLAKTVKKIKKVKKKKKLANGKVIYKKTKKKKTCYVLERDNYCYKLSGI